MKVIIEKTEVNNCAECKYSKTLPDCDFLYDDRLFCIKNMKDISLHSTVIHPDCPLPDAEPEFCEWEKKWFVKYVGISGYKISCQENDMRVVEWTDHKFCPNCGKPIKIKEN